MNLWTQWKLLWKFFGFFQTPFLRVMHVGAIILVVAQCLKILRTPFVDSWHMELGFFLVPFVLIFVGVSLQRRGVQYFFPYIFGNIEQLRKDWHMLLKGGIPAPRPGGLPGVIQGFGHICFFLSTMLGLIWYLLWEKHTLLSVDFLDYHRYFAYALMVYVLGHGWMALRHFVLWKKSQKK